MTALAETLVGLSRRERWLVGVLVALVLPVAVVFLAVMPLLAARTEARDSLERAEQVLRWVEMQAARFPPPAAAASGPGVEPGPAELEASLVAAGLRADLASMADRGGGQVEIRFDDIAFTALMPWLDGIGRSAGYRPSAFTIEARVSPGRVSATVLLEAAP